MCIFNSLIIKKMTTNPETPANPVEEGEIIANVRQPIAVRRSDRGREAERSLR